MNILFLDVETTGTDDTKHVVIEVAGRLDSNGKTVDRFSRKFFNPQGASIDLGALRVNKTSLKELMAAPAEIKEAAEFIDWLLSLPDKVQGPIIVGGQNVQFDIGFIKALLAKYSVTGLEQIIGYKQVDTFSLAVTLQAVGIIKAERLNLQGIGKAVGLDITKYKLHTADGDIDLAADSYYKIQEILKGLYDNSIQKAISE